jgi:hypothetical protein
MPRWYKIARPFLGHFLVNLIKTILGSAMVGYGIAQLRFDLPSTPPTPERRQQQKQQQQEQEEEEEEEEEEEDRAEDSSTSKYPDKNADKEINKNGNNKEESIPISSSSYSLYAALFERYVSSFVLIGVGLYFALPSLASQMLWEAAIPAITATEVAQDLATGSVFSYIKSWKPETGNYWPMKPTTTTTTGLGSNSFSGSSVGGPGGSVKNFVSPSSSARSNTM